MKLFSNSAVSIFFIRSYLDFFAFSVNCHCGINKLKFFCCTFDCIIWQFSGIRPHQHHVLSSTQNEQVNTRGTIWFYQIFSFISSFYWFYFICMWGKHHKPKFSTQSKGDGSPEWSFLKFAFFNFLFKRRNYVSFNLNIVVRCDCIWSLQKMHIQEISLILWRKSTIQVHYKIKIMCLRYELIEVIQPISTICQV
jgi:hypothetical protein